MPEPAQTESYCYLTVWPPQSLAYLAVLALIAALCRVLLYTIGRGMRTSAQWAGYMAAAITVVVLLNGIAGLWVLQDAVRLVGAISVIISVYVVWVITVRYAV